MKEDDVACCTWMGNLTCKVQAGTQRHVGGVTDLPEQESNIRWELGIVSIPYSGVSVVPKRSQCVAMRYLHQLQNKIIADGTEEMSYK
ncbi:Sexual differentiation process protein isp4 [Fusarium oxysporum f. sp. albedinis]|nr:Sexual differentiation process protein isp4 [Fusarium oxysporum f. sp. albedinis]